MKTNHFLLAILLLLTATKAAIGQAKDTTQKSSSSFLLDFENFDWNAKPAKPAETKTTPTKDTAQKSSSSFLLDFENFDWNAGPAKKTETSTTVTETKTSTTPGISTVTFGTQKWMAKNLEVTDFKNGDPIRYAKNRDEWDEASDEGEPVWCYYNSDPANGVKYGKLYNWFAVTDPRGLAPAGWHVATDAEWASLAAYLGGEKTAGTQMKSTTGWSGNGNGTNSSGFNALPAGTRPTYGDDFNLGDYGTFWTATPEDGKNAKTYSLSYMDGVLLKSYENKARGYSVRCIKD